ncbi:MAG: retroviral-like aspartic protease family protein [Oscillospiraceae bacterium]|nr:retroviral-like aspartic protease family protein [Oscillospiraceae bacterium]
MLITIDTGASVTTISKKLLYEIGYDFDEKNKSMISTASGVEYVSQTIIEKIQIGGFILNDIPVYAHTFPEESFSLGVLGLNVLELFDIELIFSKWLMVLKKIEE